MPVDVAANSKETIDDSQMQMNIYDPNSRVLQVNIPKVEIGDVVHSITRQTIERAVSFRASLRRRMFLKARVSSGTFPTKFMRRRTGRLQRMALRDEIPGTVQYSDRRPATDGDADPSLGSQPMCRACLTNPPCRPTKWFCNAFLSARRRTGRRSPNGIGI